MQLLDFECFSIHFMYDVQVAKTSRWHNLVEVLFFLILWTFKIKLKKNISRAMKSMQHSFLLSRTTYHGTGRIYLLNKAKKRVLSSPGLECNVNLWKSMWRLHTASFFSRGSWKHHVYISVLLELCANHLAPSLAYLQICQNICHHKHSESANYPIKPFCLYWSYTVYLTMTLH